MQRQWFQRSGMGGIGQAFLGHDKYYYNNNKANEKNIQTAHPPTTIKPEHATPIRWAIDAKKKRTACRTRWNLKFWQGDEDGGGGEDGENNSAMESSQTEVVFLVSLGPPRAILLDTNAINYKVCRSLNGSFNLIFVSGGQWLLIYRLSHLMVN